MGAALVILGAFVALAIPAIPMIMEWRKRTDVTPLPITESGPLERHREAVAFGESLRSGIAAAVDSYLRGGTLSGDAGEALREQFDVIGPEGNPDVDLTGPGKPVVMVNFRERVLPAGRKIFRPTYVTGDFRAQQGAALNRMYVDGHAVLDEGVWVASWIHANGDILVGAGSRLAGSVRAGRLLRIDPGVEFERLEAPEIRFGDGWHWSGDAHPDEHQLPLPVFRLGQRARRLGEGVIVEGPLVIPPDHQFGGDLVVHGSLRVGRGAIITGHVKAHGDISVHPEARINGHLFSDAAIDIGSRAVVIGAVVANAGLRLRWGAEIGLADLPATATGATVLVDQGSRVFGVVHATASGKVGVRNTAARAA